MPGNKIVGSLWSSLTQLNANLRKYGSTSKFRDFVHGAAWQMGHNSGQYPFRTWGVFILPGWINSCAQHGLFPPVPKGTFGCQTTRSTSHFFEKYWGLTSVLGLDDVPQLPDGSDRGFTVQKLPTRSWNLLQSMSAILILAMESRLYTVQHNSLPVSLGFCRKENVKLPIWPNGECQ